MECKIVNWLFFNTTTSEAGIEILGRGSHDAPVPSLSDTRRKPRSSRVWSFLERGVESTERIEGWRWTKPCWTASSPGSSPRRPPPGRDRSRCSSRSRRFDSCVYPRRRSFSPNPISFRSRPLSRFAVMKLKLVDMWVVFYWNLWDWNFFSSFFLVLIRWVLCWLLIFWFHILFLGFFPSFLWLLGMDF